PTLSSILTIGKTRGGHTLMQVLSKIMLGDVRRDWISGFCELLWTLPITRLVENSQVIARVSRSR
ncbi:MAG: hypothetical protein IJ165_13265, partial [Proteobacteria bacterium]|nr:hypothetical protein [Pseudomonadota bacterium]